MSSVASKDDLAKENINATGSDRLLEGTSVMKTVEPPKPTFYAYVVLGLILFIYICNQWQRSGK